MSLFKSRSIYKNFHLWSWHSWTWSVLLQLWGEATWLFKETPSQIIMNSVHTSTLTADWLLYLSFWKAFNYKIEVSIRGYTLPLQSSLSLAKFMFSLKTPIFIHQMGCSMIKRRNSHNTVKTRYYNIIPQTLLLSMNHQFAAMTALQAFLLR